MYRWVDHTADLELEIEGSSEEDVLRDALAALGEVLADGLDVGAGDALARDVSLSAPDRPALLADWLSELVYLAETEGFVPRTVTSLSLAGERLSARVEGWRGRPANLVKAVTLHRLAFEPDGSGWRARVVLDV